MALWVDREIELQDARAAVLRKYKGGNIRSFDDGVNQDGDVIVAEVVKSRKTAVETGQGLKKIHGKSRMAGTTHGIVFISGTYGLTIDDLAKVRPDLVPEASEASSKDRARRKQALVGRRN